MTLPITRAQARALLALKAKTPETQFIVIGAAAVGHHVKLDRPTADVDLAIAVGVDELHKLLRSLGWQRDPTMAQRWRGPEGFVADALPASAELIRRGRVQLERDVELSLQGFDLAFDSAEAVPIPDSTEVVRVASLTALVLLKMVAWVDRPDRIKDLGDLAIMLEEALGADDERRWDRDHPVGVAQLNHEDQSPFFVGCSLREVARPTHRWLIETFLSKVNDDRHRREYGPRSTRPDEMRR